MNEQERELDLMVAELEQENRLLRARNERLESEALAKDVPETNFGNMAEQPAQRKPLGFAGVTVWVGDAVATQIVTEVAIQYERVSNQSIMMAAQRCVDMLAAHGIKGDA